MKQVKSNKTRLSLLNPIDGSRTSLQQLPKLRNSKRALVKRNKNIWDKQEDAKLLELIGVHGPAHWSVIAEHLPGRQGKQCRERWRNHLCPDINKESWADDEEWRLFLLHKILGNSWATLSKLGIKWWILTVLIWSNRSSIISCTINNPRKRVIFCQFSVS